MTKNSDGKRSVELSVVVPVFNEEGNLKPLYTRLTKVMRALGEPYEIILVDDGSSDSSFQILKGLHQKDKNIKVIRFTRNFGQHIAITAGLDCCKGRFVILIDADMQHPPEEIPKLLGKLSEGYDIVYSVPSKRHDNLYRRLSSKVYLSLSVNLTGQAINPDIAPVQIMTRRVVDYMTQLKGQSTFLGRLVAWVGFPYAVVNVEHEERFAGKTGYSWQKMIRLAIKEKLFFQESTIIATAVLARLKQGSR